MAKLGQAEEELVRKQLEEETSLEFSKKKLVIGIKQDGEPKYHEFDLVSQDGGIVVEVTGAGATTPSNPNIDKCLVDCYLLEKIKAKRKILALTNKNLYQFVKTKGNGFISSDIEIRYFC